MVKEIYEVPQAEVVELFWESAICQASGTESFGSGNDSPSYPDDSWK